MDKLRAAAVQALEALLSCEEDYIYDGENEYECDSIDWDKRNAAIAALREALAEQAEQEPVAIIEKEAGFETEVYATGHADSLPDGVFKLYAAPVEPVKQEPVALGQIDQVGTIVRCVPYATTQYDKYKSMGFVVPLYAAPVRTKDLTDDEIFNLNECESSADIAFARAVIQEYRRKNGIV